MPYRVYIPQEVFDASKKFLRDKGYTVVLGNGTLEKSELEMCDAILLRTCVLDKQVIDYAKKLKVVAQHGVGYDNIDVSYCHENGIWVTYAPMANYISVSEHTMMLILLCAKNYNIINNRFRASNSDYNSRNTHCGVELKGKTLGIFGYGNIGKDLAKKAYFAFGMKVICYDPFIKKNDALDGASLVDTKEELLRDSDYVTLHVPCVASTKGFFGAHEFQQMKKNAFFINTARGELVVESELIAALEMKRIAGAAVDVYSVEPPDSSNPLFKMENVITTPHNAGLTKESLDRLSIHAAMGVHEVLTHSRPSWPLNDPSGNCNFRMKNLP